MVAIGGVGAAVKGASSFAGQTVGRPMFSPHVGPQGRLPQAHAGLVRDQG